jgi:hypothetical protein
MADTPPEIPKTADVGRGTVDGTYGFVYSGAFGVGIGVFTIRSGRFTGADSGGCEYRGTISENPNDRTLLVQPV